MTNVKRKLMQGTQSRTCFNLKKKDYHRSTVEKELPEQNFEWKQLLPNAES